MEKDFVFGNVSRNMERMRKRMRELREENGLTQAELAEELDVPRGTVASWEAGGRLPKISRVAAMAEYYDVTTDYLLGLTEGRNSCIPEGELNNKS